MDLIIIIIIMGNLFLFEEFFTNGLNHYVIMLISFLSIICGLFVIINKNPIVSVLFLIGLFLNIAGYLMMLGLNFIGLSYLLVYVGAVSILFLFILMLINVRVSELTSENNNSIPLAIVIGIIFYATLYKLLPYNNTNNFINILENTNNNILYDSSSNILFSSSNELSFITSNVWDGALAETSHITTIGNVLYTSYPLLLILTSLVLLLAMVGAIVITIKQK